MNEDVNTFNSINDNVVNNSVDLEKIDSRKKLKRNLIYLSIKICLIVLVLYILFFHVFGIQIVRNANMNPSIKEGSLVLYYRLNKKYMRGDVVSVDINGKKGIYRILALEGDVVNITDDGFVLINEASEEKESFYSTVKAINSEVKYPYTVKSDEVFLINDYRLVTSDSREFGAININNINGTVMVKLQIRNF